MINLRREAIGRKCQIRLPGCAVMPCCLCHWRQVDISGIGMKSPDLFGAWGCDHCHKQVDTAKRGDTQIQLDFARAVFRTQAHLVREGKISW